MECTSVMFTFKNLIGSSESKPCTPYPLLAAYKKTNLGGKTEAIRGVFVKNGFWGYIVIDDDGQQTEAKQTHPLESLNVYEYLKINFSTF